MSFGWLLVVGLALVVVAIALLLVQLLADEDRWLRRRWQRYVALVEARARFLLRPSYARRVARRQLLLAGAVTLVAALLGLPLLLLLVVPVALVPWFQLVSDCRRKREQVDAQLPVWLVALANSLRSSPAIADALEASTRLTPPPLQGELEMALKELSLGTPVDGALRNLQARVGTRNVSSAIATLLVARNTGGDLPRVLEETAAALREMDRLEGVVRTKTAEGKAQAYLMGAMPFLLSAALHWVDPLWLPQLTSSIVGHGILFVAICLWVGAVVMARKVLAVDI